jgi:endonuclease YncB( thermonuclease family)
MVNWDKYNIDNVTPLSFEGQTIECKVVKVYDGDTIKVVFPLKYKVKGISLFGQMYKWNCRLSRIDTPELRTKCPIEKQYGYLVRDKLREKILNKVIKITCGDFDKYGRLLIDIYIDGININDWLINSNYAFAYDGGTKKSWSEYLNQKAKINETTKSKKKVKIINLTIDTSI